MGRGSDTPRVPAATLPIPSGRLRWPGQRVLSGFRTTGPNAAGRRTEEPFDAVRGRAFRPGDRVPDSYQQPRSGGHGLAVTATPVWRSALGVVGEADAEAL